MENHNTEQLDKKLNTLQRSLISLTTEIRQVPSGDEYRFVMHHEPLKDATKKLTKQLGETVMKIMKFVNPEKIKSGLTAKYVESNYEEVKETVDDLLEQANASIDKITFGKTARDKPRSLMEYEKAQEIIKRTNNQMRKPQQFFAELIDNSYNSFVPLITEKFYTTEPIPEEIIRLQNEYRSNPEQYRKVVIKDAKKAASYYPHPYEKELMGLVYTPEQLSMSIPEIKYKELSNTPFKFVETVIELDSLARKLNTVSEFAVDLEHHSYRSYLGLTSLMQISTRDSDYIIDVIALRKSMHLLWEPFANPKVVKVFHGANWDIKWLQRDFGIYVINMFDTGQAARVLGFASYSLAHLLKELCNVTANKQYQLADWRIRPIPSDMLQYAREDTHYLLYIYDTLRRKLAAIGKVKTPKDPLTYLNLALKQSKEICLTIYQKPELKDYHYFMMIANHAASFKKLQISVLRLMLKLRDYIARVEDESTNYVFPNATLLGIARSTPTKYNELKECMKDKRLTPLLEKYSVEILERIRKKHIKYEEVQPKAPLVAEPMIISAPEKVEVQRPVVQVEFASVEPNEKFFDVDQNKNNCNENWSVLGFYKLKREAKPEVHIIEEEEEKDEVVEVEKPSKPKQKIAQKCSRKMNRFHKLSAMGSTKGSKAKIVQNEYGDQ